jgi:hypothetical protein
MAAQMKERTGSSAPIVSLTVLGEKVYGDSGDALALESTKC